MHFQQEMHGVDCAVVDEEEVELLSVTLAATRLVEESQVCNTPLRNDVVVEEAPFLP